MFSFLFVFQAFLGRAVFQGLPLVLGYIHKEEKAQRVKPARYKQGEEKRGMRCGRIRHELPIKVYPCLLSSVVLSSLLSFDR